MPAVNKFYFHAAAGDPANGPYPTTDNSTMSNSYNAPSNQKMNGTIGTGQTSVAIATTASVSNFVGILATFVSDPLEAQTIGSQNIVFQVAGSESAVASNFSMTAVISVWRPSTSAWVGKISDGTGDTAEFGTSQSTGSYTTAGSTSVVAAAGDILVVEVWRSPIAQSMATSYTNTFFFDGTTEGSNTNAASYINFPTAINVQAGAVTHVFAGTVPVVVGASANLAPMTDALAGTAPVVVGASATLKTTQRIAGTAPVVVGASAAMAKVVPGFAGTVPVVVGAVGDLQRQGITEPFAGTVPLSTATSAALSLRAAIAGTTPVVVGTSGAPSLRAALTGAAPVVVGASGALALTGALTGTAPVVVGTSGAPSLLAVLAGQTDVVTTTVGDLQSPTAGNQVFAGVIPLTADSSGALSLRAVLAGAVPVTAATSATLGVITRALAGVVAVLAGATGALGLRAALAGLSGAVSAAAASLVRLVPDWAGATPVVTTTVGDLTDVTSVTFPFDGVVPLTTSSTADLVRLAPLDGLAPIVTTVSATAGPVTASLSGEVPVTTTATSTATLRAALDGSVPVLVLPVATLTTTQRIAGVVPILTGVLGWLEYQRLRIARDKLPPAFGLFRGGRRAGAARLAARVGLATQRALLLEQPSVTYPLGRVVVSSTPGDAEGWDHVINNPEGFVVTGEDWRADVLRDNGYDLEAVT